MPDNLYCVYYCQSRKKLLNDIYYKFLLFFVFIVNLHVLTDLSGILCQTTLCTFES